MFQKKFEVKCLIVFTLVAALGMVAPLRAKASTADESGPAKKVDIKFTEVKDLKAGERAKNRPIKDKWAVVIGIDKFMAEPLNNNLKMDSAAKDFYKYLVDTKTGRFDKNHVKMMINGQATRQNIMATLGESWLGKLAGPDDLAVIFVGTHGFPAGDGNTYLCAYNTDLDNLYATGVSMNTLMQTLRNTVGTDRILLILQACYSGAAELTAGAKSLFQSYNIDVERIPLGKGYTILSSSRPDQVTWGDVFSYNLIDELKKEEGMVELNQAFEKAKDRTDYDTTHECVGCKPQTPVMKSDWKGKELVLGIPPVGRIKDLPDGVLNYLTAESHYMKANQAAGNGDLDGAIAEYKAAIATNPDYADAINDYASVLAMKGKWDEAKTQYERAIELKPDDSLFHANYARVLAKLGESGDSLSELEKAHELNPKDRVVLTALATMAIKSGNLDIGADYLKSALELYPGSAPLHDRLSYVLTRHRKFDDAIEHASEAIKIDPKLVSARLNLGSLLRIKGDSAGAIKEYREAVKLQPDNANAHYLLGGALKSVGDAAGAREELARFLDTCSANDPRMDSVKAQLSELKG